MGGERERLVMRVGAARGSAARPGDTGAPATPQSAGLQSTRERVRANPYARSAQLLHRVPRGPSHPAPQQSRFSSSSRLAGDLVQSVWRVQSREPKHRIGHVGVAKEHQRPFRPNAARDDEILEREEPIGRPGRVLQNRRDRVAGDLAQPIRVSATGHRIADDHDARIHLLEAGDHAAVERPPGACALERRKITGRAIVGRPKGGEDEVPAERDGQRDGARQHERDDGGP